MKRYLQSLKQFIQFNIVGVLNTTVDFFMFTLLTEVLQLVYFPAKVVSYTCGILNSYILNSAWTFKKERSRTAREMSLFIAVNLISLSVSLGVMYICKHVFEIESNFVANLIATPASMLVNFAGNKLFVFKKHKDFNRRPLK